MSPYTDLPMPRRVVITGIGAVCGFGLGLPAMWEGLLAGRSALGPVTRLDMSGFRSRLAAEVPGLAAKDHVPKSYRKAVKVMARDTELAVAAAKLAAADAGLLTIASQESTPGELTYPSHRMGCHIGAGLIAAEVDELTSALVTARTPAGSPAAGGFDYKAWGSGDGGAAAINNLQPLWMLKYLPNMLSCHVTIIHGCEGPSNTITCSEASGLLSLGESARVIERGDADVCFSGSAESKLNVMGILRLDLAERLAATGDQTDGAKIVRPYDPASAGSLVGEGAGILILEEAACAKARGARAYAEIAGFGAAQSGEWLGSGLERVGMASDEGIEFAIRNALDDADLTPDAIDAIAPHASGVPILDAAEAGALRAVFGDRLGRIPLITTSPNLGETMAGAGGLAAAVAAIALREQTLPARINAGTPAAGLDAGAAASRSAALRHVLVVTGALGGQNAAIILKTVS
jgi:3-oxoacyl-[acyl-carrier-protein] synthase II